MPLVIDAPRLHVEFFVKPVENAAKSRDAQRPIYEDREFVRIRFPGDNKRVLVAPAHEMHYVSREGRQMTYAEEYPQHFEAFKNENQAFIDGTPLIAAPFLGESRRAELKALNIHTVEQLASLDDRAIRKIGIGAREMVEQAKGYLDATGNASEVERLRKEVEELRRTMGAVPAMPTTTDPFEHLTEEDLKNMLRDSGRKVPPGKASRETLIAALTEDAE